jgi:hypothetical protein
MAEYHSHVVSPLEEKSRLMVGMFHEMAIQCHKVDLLDTETAVEGVSAVLWYLQSTAFVTMVQERNQPMENEAEQESERCKSGALVHILWIRWFVYIKNDRESAVVN